MNFYRRKALEVHINFTFVLHIQLTERFSRTRYSDPLNSSKTRCFVALPTTDGYKGSDSMVRRAFLLFSTIARCRELAILKQL